MKICIVLSTRPEIIKLAPLIKILKKNKNNFFLINTNQHYINLMSKVFLDFFNIPKPKYNIKEANNAKSNIVMTQIVALVNPIKILFQYVWQMFRNTQTIKITQNIALFQKFVNILPHKDLSG